MPLPNLLHPVKVTLQQIDREQTIYDEETREPIQRVERKTDKTVNGQVRWGAEKALKPTEGGAQEDSEGYVLFRYVDLKKNNIKLDLNDRIIKIGWQEHDLYITKLLPLAHYMDQNGATLVRAYFMSRQPSRAGAQD